MPIDPLQDQNDAQKSEAHATTGDASSAPTNRGDSAATRGRSTPATSTEKLNPEPPSDLQIVKDETDAGGPLVIRSGDPDLNPPKAPIDPFPTDGTPQIDPPVPR